MARKKGNLPGRYVPAHLRHAPNNRSVYIPVAAYQERVKATPSTRTDAPPQTDFESLWLTDDVEK